MVSAVRAGPVALGSIVLVHGHIGEHPGIAVIEEPETAVSIVFVLAGNVGKYHSTDLLVTGEGMCFSAQEGGQEQSRPTPQHQ
jgi:hypothetical protein